MLQHDYIYSDPVSLLPLRQNLPLHTKSTDYLRIEKNHRGIYKPANDCSSNDETRAKPNVRAYRARTFVTNERRTRVGANKYRRIDRDVKKANPDESAVSVPEWERDVPWRFLSRF